MYRKGWGVKQDDEQARHWYEKAAAGGNVTAMVDLGRIYERGLGVQQDTVRARQWYEKAAAAGNPAAAKDLARPSREEKASSGTRNPSPEASALFQKARTEWQRGDRNVAIADVTEVISNSPHWPVVYLSRANWEYDMGNIKAALADYSACIERQPIKVNLISALIGRAKARDRLGDTRAAEADREQAHKLQNEIR
jgi:TPR repeat protein